MSHNLPTAAPGFYVLLNPRADLVSLCRLGEDIDTGNLVATHETVEVPIADLSFFQSTSLSIEVTALPWIESDTTVVIGDILEPTNENAALPIGLYQVIMTEVDRVLVSRLHSNEDGKLATTGRNTWIARDELASFRKLRIAAELRP